MAIVWVPIVTASWVFLHSTEDLLHEYRDEVLLMLLAAIGWVSMTVWQLYQRNWRGVGLLIWAFVAVSPLISWAWEATAHDRAIAAVVHYRRAMEEWSHYRDLVPASEWQEHQNYLRSRYMTANAMEEEALLAEKRVAESLLKRRILFYGLPSMFGFLMFCWLLLDRSDFDLSLRR